MWLPQEAFMLVKPEEVGLSAQRLKRIGTHVQRYIDAGKVAGTLTLVARQGQIAYFEPQGYLELERTRPVQHDSIFRIYSMSKPITSVGLMMLYEQGLFQLDDPVHKFIPSWANLRVFVSGDYPSFATAPPARAMTIRDLLTHTSGLTYGSVDGTNVDAAYRTVGVWDMNKPGYTLQNMVDNLAQLPLEFSPGTRWNYSVSTDVLGYLIEVISGQRFDVYLREHIFEPLGMRDTSFTIAEAQLARFACNYERQRDGSLKLIDAPERSQYRNRSLFSGGGGLVSTAGGFFPLSPLVGQHRAPGWLRPLGAQSGEMVT